MAGIPRSGNPAVGGIMDYVRSRRLQPGDRLPSERDFAERLGIGRNAVREAIATLVALRVVEARPNSGIYLRRYEKDSSFEALVMLAGLGEVPDATEVDETMAVREHLELLAVGLACRHRTAHDVERLEGVLRETRAALAAGEGIAAWDTEFHLAVAEAAHNSVLVRVLNAFYQFTAPRREVMFRDAQQSSRTLTEHMELLASVRAGDEPAARRLMLTHMARARTYWSVVFDEGKPSLEESAGAAHAPPTHLSP
ncbi:FadR family transcriptional regulator [Verticiella sediminum]|uniref:FadR family transcriptional regulator n=1 Tax=Verticiella sediminum TaxID=1247510 RepID=A0A556AJJ2_9BURK|nr:FadR/GntR family transcriptional regulator [Verticiella sediminum]TSH93078.1 FadR family transcriptional regulator [Verticiella sediminum]